MSLDSIFTFLLRVFAVPGLHAIITAICAGLALTYLLQLPLPAWTPVKVAVQYARLLVFLVVLGIAVALVRTPLMAAWATTVAIFVPLFYDWLTAIIYHRWPWLKPKSLLTGPEMQNRIADRSPP